MHQSLIQSVNQSVNNFINYLQLELRRLEDLSEAIVNDFAYMRAREEEMRDTNESTNSRVFYFSIFSMLCLLGLACAQVLYLKKYFKSKKLIEWWWWWRNPRARLNYTCVYRAMRVRVYRRLNVLGTYLMKKIRSPISLSRDQSYFHFSV